MIEAGATPREWNVVLLAPPGEGDPVEDLGPLVDDAGVLGVVLDYEGEETLAEDVFQYTFIGPRAGGLPSLTLTDDFPGGRTVLTFVGFSPTAEAAARAWLAAHLPCWTLDAVHAALAADPDANSALLGHLGLMEEPGRNAPATVSVVLRALASEELATVYEALSVAVMQDQPEYRGPVRALAQDHPDANVREAAAEALAQMAGGGGT